MRDVRAKYYKDDKNAKLCYEMYGYRDQKVHRFFFALLNGVDTLILLAGLGENDTLPENMPVKL